jgi:ATPase family associated with various cellular activities (AAA)
MIDLTLPLIGDCLLALEKLRLLLRRKQLKAALCYGPPGVGKTHLSDLLAREVTGSPFAIEQVNGQSLSVDLVRDWRERAAYGNLFSAWTVKRVDEFDCASPQARNEILSLLDYLPPNHLILATTNDYQAVRSADNRRLESRFKCLPVDGPGILDATAYLRKEFRLPAATAGEIARGASSHCLGFDGVNMRQAVADAQNWLAERSLEEAA